MGKRRKEISERMTLPFEGRQQRLGEITETREGRIFLVQLICGKLFPDIPSEMYRRPAFFSALAKVGWTRPEIQKMAENEEIPIDPGVFGQM